jgi:hypothetical protein
MSNRSIRGARGAARRGGGAGATCEPLEGRQLLAADLVATGIVGRLPQALISGERGRIPGLGVDVSNAGILDARGDVVFRLFASADGALDAGDPLLVEQSRRLRLKAGKSTRVRLRFRDVPAGIPQGTYRLIALVDATNVIPEDNEGNNVIASTGSISIGPAFVDLTATRAFVRPPLRGGRNSLLLLTVLNAGNDTAKGTGVVRVTFTRVGEVTPGAPIDVPVKINIKSQKTKQLRGRIAVPAGQAPGGYTVTATILSTLPFTDSNPSNNTATVPVTVV